MHYTLKFQHILFQFVGLESLMTAITDMNPNFFLQGHRRKLFLLLICIGCFLLGLLMVTEVTMLIMKTFFLLLFFYIKGYFKSVIFILNSLVLSESLHCKNLTCKCWSFFFCLFRVGWIGWPVCLPVVWLLFLQWNDPPAVCHCTVNMYWLVLWWVIILNPLFKMQKVHMFGCHCWANARLWYFCLLFDHCFKN